MSQLAFETLKKPCSLTTIGFFTDDSGPHSIRYNRPYAYRAECACGWKSEQTAKGHEAAGLWTDHAGLR